MGTGVTLFDANAMLGPAPTVAGLEDEAALLAAMDRHRIGEALVTHTYAWRHDPAAGNRRLGDELRSPRLHPCWVLMPDPCREGLPAPDGLEAALVAAQVRAVRLYPRAHGYQLVNDDCGSMLTVLERAGSVLLLDRDQVEWGEVEAIAGRHPALTIVLSRLGYRSLRALTPVMARHLRVVVDTSMLTGHQGLEWLVARFGAGRVVFGTGAPLQDPADAVARLLWSGLDDAEMGEVGGGTLRSLLGGRP